MPSPAVDAVQREFRVEFRREPDGVWSAPGRVNLMGEHTDYNQGLVLPIALPQRVHVAARRRTDRTVRLWSAQTRHLITASLDGLSPAAADGWSAYAVGVLWALEHHGYQISGVDLAIDGRVPLGAGLSSSAALECAVAVAVCDLFDLRLHGVEDGIRNELAALCAFAENAFVGAPTGGMDQLASLRCQEDAALLLDMRNGWSEQIPLVLADHGLDIVVMDTKVVHALVDGQYASRRRACQQACELLGVASLREVLTGDLPMTFQRLPDEVMRRRVRHVVTEIARVSETAESLLSADFDKVGTLLDASHRSLRDDFEVSCPELDLAVQTARDVGALGARMTGGGFGGSAIALTPLQASGDVQTAVARAYWDAGWRPPDCFSVQPGPAAGRDV